MTTLSLKDFKWDREKNILSIHSDHPAISENWTFLVINKGYFDVKSHVTGVTYSYVYVIIIDNNKDRKKWDRVLFSAPGTDASIPDIHILPPKTGSVENDDETEQSK